jgi:hypothetical protein
VEGSWGHGNEYSCSIKGGEFFDYLITISFTKRTLLHGVVSYGCGTFSHSNGRTQQIQDV